MTHSARGGKFRAGLCVAGVVAVLGSLCWKCSVSFSTPGLKQNRTDDEAGKRLRVSRFYTSAAGQSVTDYNLTSQESLLLSKVNHAAVRLDWQRIQRLKASSKVLKTPVFDVEMNAALKCAQYEAGISLYERLCDLGLPKEILTLNLAVKLYSKAGRWSHVKKVWREARALHRMDETMAAARLVAAADEGDIQTAAAVLDEMIQMELEADVGHFTSAIRACAASESGAYPAATYLFQTMLNMSVAPDTLAFAAVVSTYVGRPVSVFQQLRAQMRQLGVKATTDFSEAYLKALLGVQTNKKYSTGELAGLMRGLSDGRLQEAAEMLSELMTTDDELSSFCQCTKLALKRVGFEP